MNQNDSGNVSLTTQCKTGSVSGTSIHLNVGNMAITRLQSQLKEISALLKKTKRVYPQKAKKGRGRNPY
jgi:hypothetical protein